MIWTRHLVPMDSDRSKSIHRLCPYVLRPSMSCVEPFVILASCGAVVHQRRSSASAHILACLITWKNIVLAVVRERSPPASAHIIATPCFIRLLSFQSALVYHLHYAWCTSPPNDYNLNHCIIYQYSWGTPSQDMVTLSGSINCISSDFTVMRRRRPPALAQHSQLYVVPGALKRAKSLPHSNLVHICDNCLQDPVHLSNEA